MKTFLMLFISIGLFATDIVVSSNNKMQRLDPDIIRTSMQYQWGSSWGGLLDVIYSNKITLNKESSPNRTYITKLYDGKRGNFDNWPGDYVLFDGQKAIIDIKILKGEKLKSISFNSIEIENKPKSKVYLLINSKKIYLKRKVIENRGKALLVNYSLKNTLISEEKVTLYYLSNYMTTVFIDELVINNVGPYKNKYYEKNKTNINSSINTLDRWRYAHLDVECKNIDNILKVSIKKRIKELLGKPSKIIPSELIYLSNLEYKDFSIYQVILKVDDTSDRFIDTVRGWFILPSNTNGKIPLAVLNHQGHIYAGTENIGFLGEKSIQYAEDLARLGIASLVIEAYQHTYINFTEKNLLQYHPKWSYSGKDLDNIKRGLDFVLSDKFKSITNIEIDSERIANWGYSFGSWNSLISGLLDDRYDLVTFSAFHYRSKDIAYGLSSAMYMPLLSCFKNETIPIKMSDIIYGYGDKNVMAVIPDMALLKEWSVNVKNKNNINLVVNPYGHVATESEKIEIINHMLKIFKIDKKLISNEPKHILIKTDEEMLPFLQRDNDWRTKVLNAFKE